MKLWRRLLARQVPEPPIRTTEGLNRHLADLTRAGRLLPRKTQDDFERLVDVVDEELRAQIAIQRLGAASPTEDQIRSTAALVADQVDWVFEYALKRRPGNHASSDLSKH